MVKKGRGRPRKEGSAGDSKKSDVATGEDGTPIVKKGRGRPRKEAA